MKKQIRSTLLTVTSSSNWEVKVAEVGTAAKTSHKRLQQLDKIKYGCRWLLNNNTIN